MVFRSRVPAYDVHLLPEQFQVAIGHLPALGAVVPVFARVPCRTRCWRSLIC